MSFQCWPFPRVNVETVLYGHGILHVFLDGKTATVYIVVPNTNELVLSVPERATGPISQRIVVWTFQMRSKVCLRARMSIEFRNVFVEGFVTFQISSCFR